MKQSISYLYKEGSLSKYLPILGTKYFNNENFSERYKQTCGKQVKYNICSSLTNIENKIRNIITNSSLKSEEKIALYYINKYHLWFKKEIPLKGVSIPPHLLKLCRRLYKQCKGREPVLRNVCMQLDKKVAELCKPEKASQFDYWIKLATLKKGEPIYLPLKSYKFFNESKGTLKNQIQVIVRTDKIEYGIVKEEPEVPSKTEGSIVGIDSGMVTLLSSSNGNAYGQGLYGKLKRYDEIITRIKKKRQKNGLRNNGCKLDNLNAKVRNLIKNEVGKALNRFIYKEGPKEIVVENLTGMIQNKNCKLSRTTKRLLHNCGISQVSKRLETKSGKNGFKINKINPAYTSKECPKCHSIDDKNRPSQSKFKCISCGYARNADYVGSVNIRNRRSISAINIYTPYKKVRELIKEHYKSNNSGLTFQPPGSCSWALATSSG
jgi:putative transposase